jgi:homeobox protein cut-like
VEELQQQVRALQAVGYGAVDETLLGTSSSSSGEQGRGQPSSSGGAGLGPPGSSSSSSMTLEGMLLAKNRKLEHDVTLARLQVAEASQNLEASQLRVSDLEAQVSDQQQLIEQLEDDLRAAASAGVGAQGLLAAGALGSHPSDSGGVAAGVLGDTNAAAGDHAEMSVVRVLAGQRDRLRQRVQELEEGLAAAKQEVTQVKAQLEAAKADNIALIERLRYVGGYRQQSAARAGAEEGEGKGGGGEDVEAGKGADVVGRYTRLYEEGINPFKEFQVRKGE